MAKWKQRGLIFGLVVVGLTAAAYATGMSSQDVQQPLPATIGNLAAVTRVEVAEQSAVVLSGQFGAEERDGDELKREAQLTGADGANGEAEIELDADDRTRQEFEVEVEGLRASTTYQVLVDGQVAGTITTDARGEGSLELSRTTAPQ
jgi:hypothetical protein